MSTQHGVVTGTLEDRADKYCVDFERKGWEQLDLTGTAFTTANMPAVMPETGASGPAALRNVPEMVSGDMQRDAERLEWERNAAQQGMSTAMRATEPMLSSSFTYLLSPEADDFANSRDSIARFSSQHRK